MATKKTTEASTVAETAEATTTKAAQNETVYTVDEFAAAANKMFGCKARVVKAAFLYADKTKATKAEAAEIINSFRTREVK